MALTDVQSPPDDTQIRHVLLRLKNRRLPLPAGHLRFCGHGTPARMSDSLVTPALSSSRPSP
jgi:hypothetical protein